jgi:hypothetical protein
VRRDLTVNTGHFKSIGGITNNWYVEAVREDPGCCASKKATRLQEERLTHQVSSVAFKEKYSFNVDTMDIEALITRVYDWVVSVTALRLEQAYTFDVRNMFESKPHTDEMIAPPGDKRPWMNNTDESQVLMFFQTYGKNEGINITRGQVTYHRDPVPIKNLRQVDGSMVQPIATIIIMLMRAHDYMAASNCGHPQPSHALFKKILRGSNNECRTIHECYPNMTNAWDTSNAQVAKPPFAKEKMPKKHFLQLPKKYLGVNSASTHSLRANSVSTFCRRARWGTASSRASKAARGLRLRPTPMSAIQ